MGKHGNNTHASQYRHEYRKMLMGSTQTEIEDPAVNIPIEKFTDALPISFISKDMYKCPFGKLLKSMENMYQLTITYSRDKNLIYIFSELIYPDAIYPHKSKQYTTIDGSREINFTRTKEFAYIDGWKVSRLVECSKGNILIYFLI